MQSGHLISTLSFGIDMTCRRVALPTAFALTLLCLVACNRTPDAAGSAATPTKVAVGVVVLQPQAVPLEVELPGRVVASLEAEVRPQISGLIQQRLFREGSEVRAGQVLYQIDAASYRAAHANAAAALQKAQSAVPGAQAKADRTRGLVQQNALSRQEAETAADTLAQVRADVAAAQAALETARIDLARTTIAAPISGRIGKSSLTPGALVTASQATALATIHRIDVVNVDLTQASTSWLDLRQAIAAGRSAAAAANVDVRLLLENGSAYPLAGKLAFAESTVDKNTGAYTLRATVPNPERLLLPGMYVRAVVAQGTAQNAFLVPQRAVSRNPRGEPTALFVKNGTVEQRVLAATRSVGNAWLVERGIAAGEQVIVEGSQSVRDGDAVDATEVALDAASGGVRAAAASQQPAR